MRNAAKRMNPSSSTIRIKKQNRKSVFWSYFLEPREIVLTTHVRPDGDGLASECALYSLLSKMGKHVHIINQDKTPEMYGWLPFADKITALADEKRIKPGNIDLAVLLDCSGKERIGDVYDVIKSSKVVVSLDHHEDAECFRDYCLIDPAASSIGELLYDIVPDLRSYLDRDIATCIYVSIMTDTGSFAFSNTTSRVFQIVSRLMKYGVDADFAYRMIYNNKRINHFRLLGKVLGLLKTDETGKVVYVLLPASVYRETEALEEDNEGILEVIRGMRKVELIILLRQLDGGRLKGSLRSLHSINCNYLARIFGGGGHYKAAGFVVEGKVEQIGGAIVARMLDAAKERGWI